MRDTNEYAAPGAEVRQGLFPGGIFDYAMPKRWCRHILLASNGKEFLKGADNHENPNDFSS
jgi:hypothetical protein